MIYRIVVMELLLLMAGSHETLAEPIPECQKLQGPKKVLAEKILSSQYPYDCCDSTIAKCLKNEKVCALAWRLARDVCRRVEKGQDEKKILRSLSKRARSMMTGGKTFSIDIEKTPYAGPKDARVTVVEYACPRCPFCSKITPVVHEAVTTGPLKDKIRLVFKTFPLKSHKNSKEAGLAFVAAARLGKFWEFMRYSYAHFDSFCTKLQSQWAEAVGMDKARFESLVKDPGVRKELVNNVKEGLRNKVEATPTFFINGRRYVGDLDTDELQDVFEEEYDRVTGKQFR